MLELILYLLTGMVLVGLFTTTYVGVRDENEVLAVNAAASIVVVAIPLLVDISGGAVFEGAIEIGPVLPLWIAVADALHTIGMMNIYERVWWWDHLTHTVTASLVAAVVYGTLVAIGSDPISPDITWATIAALTVAITMLAGVLWELIELVGRELAIAFDREPMLIPYGRYDTALDLVFDAVGAIIIIAVDLRSFESIAAQSPDFAWTALIWVISFMALTTAGLAGVLLWHHRDRIR